MNDFEKLDNKNFMGIEELDDSAQKKKIEKKKRLRKEQEKQITFFVDGDRHPRTCNIDEYLQEVERQMQDFDY